MLELDRTPKVLREERDRNGCEPKDGIVKIPDRPGLGVDINHGVLEQYRVSR